MRKVRQLPLDRGRSRFNGAIADRDNLARIGYPYQQYLTSNQPILPLVFLTSGFAKKANLCRLPRINVKFFSKCSIVINELTIVDPFVPALVLKYTIPFLATGFES